MKLRKRVVRVVSETNKVRIIKLELFKPNENNELVVSGVRISSKSPRYVVWVENEEGRLIQGWYSMSISGEYRKCYKVFDSRELAVRCFEQTLLFYKWQQLLEQGCKTMPSEYYLGLQIRYNYHFHPLMEGVCGNFQILKEH